MAIVKVIEVLAQSDKSWEDAAQQALKEASRTIRNIKSLYVKEMQAVMRDDPSGVPKLQYRLDAKISFEVEPEKAEAHGRGSRIERATH